MKNCIWYIPWNILKTPYRIATIITIIHSKKSFKKKVKKNVMNKSDSGQRIL